MQAKISDAVERDPPRSARHGIGLKTFCSKHIDPRITDSVWMESQMRSHVLRAFESRQGELRDLANPENLQ
jgi:hypothetical protein